MSLLAIDMDFSIDVVLLFECVTIELKESFDVILLVLKFYLTDNLMAKGTHEQTINRIVIMIELYGVSILEFDKLMAFARHFSAG